MAKRRVAAKAVGRTAISAAGAAVGAAIGSVMPGPGGAALGGVVAGVIGDVTNRLLSEHEASRVSVVLESAAATVAEQEGDPVHESAELGPMFEGTLLAARDAYEEKKLPLLANLFATAPFTSTPVVNMLGSLQLVSTLSYRQLCILAIIRPYEPWPGPELTKQTIGELLQANFAEAEQGLLYDLIDLYERGLVVATLGGNITFQPYADVSVSDMMLSYPAMLVHNGARLRATIPDEDLDLTLRVLGA
jgi:hypothetical protein